MRPHSTCCAAHGFAQVSVEYVLRHNLSTFVYRHRRRVVLLIDGAHPANLVGAARPYGTIFAAVNAADYGTACLNVDRGIFVPVPSVACQN